ncbi:MAG: acetylxylan esterase, partial [Lentisphaeria bacterium]|nr:acetylxylan esterase [Lentisphaeria bacterium]
QWKIGLAALLLTAGAVMSGAPNDAKPKVYPDVQIIGSTDKSPLSYKPGDEMVYTFKVDFGKSEPGEWFLRYVRRGDDGKTFSGKVSAKETLTVKTSLDRPGFVNVEVRLVDAKGKPVQRDPGRRGMIGYYAGTAVEPEKLKDCGEPADFDEFWEKQKKRLAAVPFKDTTECKLAAERKDGNIYAVSIPCAGPRPATGYLTVPKNAKPKSLMAQIQFFGYAEAIQPIPGRVVPGRLVFYLNAHGQKLGQNKDYYKKFFASIRSNKYSYAFDPEQNKDPENCFFNGMVFRVLRALEYLKTRPEWDGKNQIAFGGSQGGLQTMWAAALDQDVNIASPSITWCCDLAGNAKAKRLCGNWRIKYVPALDYYDPVFMAKRITKAQVDIRRAGLGDYTCPPSGLAISYFNLKTPKKSIRWVQGSNHPFVPKESDVVVWSTMKK